MFTIKVKDIHEEFIKRYGGEKDGLRTFSVSCGLTLCGKGFNRIDRNIYSCTLSLSTYVTIKTNDSGIFCIQMSDENIMYECGNKELSGYDSKAKVSEIFKCIDRFKGNVSGAEILFCFDAENNNFKRYCEATAIAFEIINYGYVREENKNLSFGKQNNNFIAGELFGKKNILFGLDGDGKNDIIPFYNEGKKIILITTDITYADISEKVSTAYNKLKKENKYTDIEALCKNTKAGSEDKYESYVINEINRTQSMLKLTKRGHINNIQEYIDENVYEFSGLSGRNGNKLIDIYENMCKCGICELVIPACEYNGIAAIVKDMAVDNFIKKMYSILEEIIGHAPAFYICDTADSGIELSQE